MSSEVRALAERRTHLLGRGNEKVVQEHLAMRSGGADRSSIHERPPAKSFETTKNPEDKE
jgi:hypothetical protein